MAFVTVTLCPRVSLSPVKETPSPRLCQDLPAGHLSPVGSHVPASAGPSPHSAPGSPCFSGRDDRVAGGRHVPVTGRGRAPTQRGLSLNLSSHRVLRACSVVGSLPRCRLCCVLLVDKTEFQACWCPESEALGETGNSTDTCPEAPWPPALPGVRVRLPCCEAPCVRAAPGQPP